MQNIVLAVTTFNRLQCLKKLIDSFKEFRSRACNYIVIIADDGSTDGSIEYLESLEIDSVAVQIIRNNRQGIHHQFNTIVKVLEKLKFDVCFKCDDDIEFVRPGWEKLYSDSIAETGYDHLCYFDSSWRPNKNLKTPIIKKELIARCKLIDVQGAFFTLTPRVITTIGFMDTRNFGFRGVGHIDYTMRAARAGFNDISHPFDIMNSAKYIKHQSFGTKYSSAMNLHLVSAIENDTDSRKKYELILNPSRMYISYYKNAPSLSMEIERDLLIKRIESLEEEKRWYKSTYGHQPKWFVRLGKLLFRILIGKKV